MFRTMGVLLVCSVSVVFGGCSGEKQPERDPNFKVSDNPSDITVPAQMMKSKPSGDIKPAGTSTPAEPAKP